jgi:hypothetical protein
VRSSIIVVALVTAVTAWLLGFFDSILEGVVPSGSEAFCVLRETLDYRWPFAPRPRVSDRFSILIATMDHDDTYHTYTRAVREAFLKQDDINHIETCRVLRLSNDGRDAEIFAVATARKWLEDRRADLLIAGEVHKIDETVSLWFINNDKPQAWRPLIFRLDANLLKQDYSKTGSTQLLALALSAIKPATPINELYLVVVLKSLAVRLRHLLDFTTRLTATQKAGCVCAILSTKGTGADGGWGVREKRRNNPMHCRNYLTTLHRPTGEAYSC